MRKYASIRKKSKLSASYSTAKSTKIKTQPQEGAMQNALLPPKTAKTMIDNNIKEIADMVTANTLFTTKEVLTSDEAAQYMGISKSYLYKLTMRGEIPHYKPMGKMCYFNRLELEQWLQQNRVASSTEIADAANRYCMKGGSL